MAIDNVGWNIGSAPLWAALVSAVLVLVHITICVAALGVIPGNRKPSTGMAWLILILAVPFFGLHRFPASWEHARREADGMTSNGTSTTLSVSAPRPYRRVTRPPAGAAAHASAAILNRNLGTLPVVAGNTVELHPDYDGYFAAMTDAVDEAQHFVHVEFYISSWDTTTSDFFDALVRASKRGVTVRLLFDHLGSRSGSGYREMLGSARRRRDRLETDAGDRSPPWKGATPRSPEPPQDPGGGQHDCLHGLTELDRNDVWQAPRTREKDGSMSS